MPISSSTFWNQHIPTLEEPENSLPWQVGKDSHFLDIHGLGQGTQRVLTHFTDTGQILASAVDPNGVTVRGAIPIGEMASPELAHFVVKAVNAYSRSTATTDLTPEQLLKATENVIAEADFGKASQKELQEALNQARVRERAAVEQLRSVREELASAQRELGHRVSHIEKLFTHLNAELDARKKDNLTIVGQQRRIQELEKEKADRIARESGVLKTGGGRRMRFKERSNDEQDQGIAGSSAA